MTSEVVSYAYPDSPDADATSCSLWHAVSRKACSFTGIPHTVANHLHVRSQKGISAAPATSAVPGKAEKWHIALMFMLRSKHQPGSAVTCHGSFCSAIPCAGLFEGHLFTAAAQTQP